MGKKVKPEELDGILATLNHSIRHTGRYLMAQGRNGHMAVDIYRGEASEGFNGVAVDVLAVGTTAECLKAAEAYAKNPH
ncbi:hypothetical protein D3C76_165400 [compost metagenome]